MTRVEEDAAVKGTSPLVWRLMIFAVPENLGGLLARLGFKQTKKNLAHWWRLYDPDTDHDKASAARLLLIEAGLKGKWSTVRRAPGKPYAPRHTGTRNFAQHHVGGRGGWRMKATS